MCCKKKPITIFKKIACASLKLFGKKKQEINNEKKNLSEKFCFIYIAETGCVCIHMACILALQA